MKLGIGHGPRFHGNMFGAWCPRWPCLQPTTTSSIGSASTHSSVLLDNDDDNDYTSSWSYVHFHQASSADDHQADTNSNHTGSTLNDTELISLVNRGAAGGAADGGEATGDAAGQAGNTNEVLAALPWLNLTSGERHVRADVRTLFPDVAGAAGADVELQTGSGFQTASSSAGAECDACGVSAECQYVNLPAVQGVRRGRAECIPVYAAGRGTSRSMSSQGSGSGHSLGSLFDLDAADSSDWATGGDHPYGIPSSLLGGVLLNLDSQFRMSSNAEWNNWSEFFTCAQEPNVQASRGEGQSNHDNPLTDACGSNPSSSTASLSDVNNSLNNENTSDNASTDNVGQNSSGSDVLPSSAFPHNRHITLPPPPLSNSSSCSSGNGSTSRLRHQEWYFYDPRLVSEQRTERVTLDTSFRGLHNRCVMSSIIQPPAYDEIIQGDGGEVIESGGEITLNMPEMELPPPYSEYLPAEPPPSYDQSFGHNLAFPTFHNGLPVNPLERRLAASLCTSPFIMPAMSPPIPEPDLLTDVNIDELLDGPSDSRNQNNRMDNSVPASDGVGNDIRQSDSGGDDGNPDAESDGEVLMESCSEEELLEEHEASNGEPDNSQFSFRRYPVGFCLGRRPPLRWSRGMAPNRWAPTENWATH